jgi:hypothetical protein
MFTFEISGRRRLRERFQAEFSRKGAKAVTILTITTLARLRP